MEGCVRAMTQEGQSAHKKGPSIMVMRRAIADYMRTEGCSCCRDIDGHEKAKKRLAKLLNVPQYDDGSGFDFYRFSTKEGFV